MNPLFSAPYFLAGQLARAAAAVAPAGGGKVRRSLHARRGIRARYTAWGATHRDRRRPLLWVHAPSVGEGLMAVPVIALLRERHPDWQVAYTFFSPSAEQFAARIGADFTDYLPFDTVGDAEVALDSLAPTALIFSKLDLWPVLAQHAAQRGVSLGMISASLPAGSRRTSPFAARLLFQAYRGLDAVGSVDAHDASRLTALGVLAERVSVTGDTRYDQVWARVRAPDRAIPPLASLADNRPTLVAGSTWPGDERVLFAAWRGVRAEIPNARLIVAPHETTSAHIESVERVSQALGLVTARLGASNVRAADVVVVDRVGVLADLYALATVSYVGGGFHDQGLHSVVEPAAYGAPVLFGPQHTNSRDAVALLAAGGGFSAPTSEALGARLVALLGDAAARSAAGARAREVVVAGLGAAERSASIVERLMGPRLQR